MVPIPAKVARLLIPIPQDCSERFAEGWAVADRAIAMGIALEPSELSSWDEEKQAGYLAREAAT
jgi:hypothetical protein